jgi:outer membrane protein OmpA-like peptidoglycan-associated protein
MFYKKTLLILTLLFFASSCVNNKIQDLNSRAAELKSRNTFNGYLALEYLQYSKDLSSKYTNLFDTNYFIKKGIRAARNETVYPEVPEKWNLDNSQIESASLGRRKLVALLVNPKAKHLLPIQMAHLQLLYDCWISREQEPWQVSDMGRCKILFFRLENEITEYLKKPKPTKEIKIVEIKEPEFSRFDIYFDFDLYKFNSEANSVFRELFNNLSDLDGNYRILLVGSADRRGKKLYNDALSRKRVLAVKNTLTKNGVPGDMIETKAFGEENPEIITKNGERNSDNRRVSIYVSKGQDSLSVIPLPLIDNYIYKKEINRSKRRRGIN